MLNRFLFLLVAVISPAASVAMLFSGHAADVTFAERLPCLTCVAQVAGVSRASRQLRAGRKRVRAWGGRELMGSDSWG